MKRLMLLLCAFSFAQAENMVLDNFSGSVPNTTLGAAIGGGGGAWYNANDAHNPASFVKSLDGSSTSLNSIIKKDIGIQAKMFLHKPYPDTANPDTTKHGELVYGYCQISTPFVASKGYFDLSALTGVMIRAKGTGTMHVSFSTALTSKPGLWGDFGANFTLTPDFTDIIVNASSLRGSTSSTFESISWTADSVSNKVSVINFTIPTAGDTVNVTISQVVLLGVGPSAFGITNYTGPTYEGSGVITKEKSVVAANGLFCPAVFRPNSSFSVAPSTSLSIYDLTGNRMAVLDASGNANSIVWNGCNVSGNLVANGTYFAQARTNGSVVSRKFQFVR